MPSLPAQINGIWCTVNLFLRHGYAEKTLGTEHVNPFPETTIDHPSRHQDINFKYGKKGTRSGAGKKQHKPSTGGQLFRDDYLYYHLTVCYSTQGCMHNRLAHRLGVNFPLNLRRARRSQAGLQMRLHLVP